MNIPNITFPSVLSVNPNKTQQSWAGSQLWNVLKICCKYWNHICLAVLPGFHYEVLVSLMPQVLWTQIKTSENFDMHICKRFSALHSTVLALPHTSEQPLWVPEFGGTKEARNTWEKKKENVCVIQLNFSRGCCNCLYVGLLIAETSSSPFPVFFTSNPCQNILFFLIP